MQITNALAKEGKINENASIKDQHSIIINAPIEKVWEILIDLNSWHEWNKEISGMKVEGEIKEGTKFKWVNHGKKTSSQIQQFKAPTDLAWSGKTSLVKEIQSWQLESDEGQTIVTLSASLHGAFTFFVNSHLKVYNELINWIESLKARAEEE